MIQDIFPDVFHVEYPPLSPQEDDAVICFEDRRILLLNNRFPTVKEMADPSLKDSLYYLFRISDYSCFLLDRDKIAVAFPCAAQCDEGGSGLRLVPLSYLRALRPMTLAFTGYTASHIAAWLSQNRFCGCCGHPMIYGTDERKMVCPSCKNIIYPRINPAVIVAVYDDHDRLLMTRYRTGHVSWFVLIAGFVEIGESAEDTVRREVMEEAGVHVADIRYYGSQPWGIPGNLTLGYTARLDGSDKITLDNQELSDARWIPRSEVPLPDDAVSITSAMIHAYKRGEF